MAIFLALSCSNDKISLDLSVGDCFVDLSNMAVNVDGYDAGDMIDLTAVEEIDCSEPHNAEIYAEFTSVPLKYRSEDDPFDAACYGSLIDYIGYLYPVEYDSQLLDGFVEEFDKKFSYITNFYTLPEGSSDIGDIDNYFNCQLISDNSLLFGKFEETIRKLF
tara:strand:- start:248 stop:733 length:486 start_codon:yes stop_codon:yes gene_type:complete